MNKQLLGLAVALCILAGAARTEEDNPLKKAKVGDWVAYKGTTEAQGMSLPIERKLTVIAKSETEVSIEIVQKGMGQDTTAINKIDLTRKYDQRPAGIADPNAKVTETEKGEETLTIGGKTFKTAWVNCEISGMMQGQPMVVKSKLWTCPDVPLGGMVKTVTDMGVAKATVELSDFGFGK